jgi:hypothetical protein
MRSQALVFDSSVVITGVGTGVVAARRVAYAPACRWRGGLAVAGPECA